MQTCLYFHCKTRQTFSLEPPSGYLSWDIWNISPQREHQLVSTFLCDTIKPSAHRPWRWWKWFNQLPPSVSDLHGFVQTSNISTLTWFVFIVCCPAADPVFCVTQYCAHLSSANRWHYESQKRPDSGAAYGPCEGPNNPIEPLLQLTLNGSWITEVSSLFPLRCILKSSRPNHFQQAGL